MLNPAQFLYGVTQSEIEATIKTLTGIIEHSKRNLPRHGECRPELPPDITATEIAAMHTHELTMIHDWSAAHHCITLLKGGD